MMHPLPAAAAALLHQQQHVPQHFPSQQQQQQQQQAAAAVFLQPPLPAGVLLDPPPHNLIPSHLQAISFSSSSLHGTPGHSPAVIPALPSTLSAVQPLITTQSTFSSSFLHPLSQLSNEAQQQQQQQQNQQQQAQLQFLAQQLHNDMARAAAAAAVVHPPHPVWTVQDRPLTPPVYNGVNPAYPGLKVVHTNPPIFAVDNFLTPHECDFLIHVAQDSFGPAPVVGKGAGEVSPSRTSSTCYLAREDLPAVLRKVNCLTGKPVEHCELPQVGRYFPTQQYLQHFDAFDLSTEDGQRFASNGGQRVVTVLIYLNTVERGGATRFPALNVQVQPVRGMALVFFPATVDGLLDQMALHAAMPAVDTKYVSQIWIRQSVYNGQPSKRLPQILGVPFGQEQLQHEPLQQQPASAPGLAAVMFPHAQLQQQTQQNVPEAMDHSPDRSHYR